MEDFRAVKLAATSGPDVHFEGRVIGEYSTQRKDGGKSRWQELRLWETRSGNWIAELVGCSSEHGHRELRDVRVIEEPTARNLVGEGGGGIGDAREDAMELWGWSSAARALARGLGWDLVRRVP